MSIYLSLSLCICFWQIICQFRLTLHIQTLYLLFICLMSRLFANSPRDRGSIPGRVIPKTQKMVLDATIHSTQDYKVSIKSKVDQSTEKSSSLPFILVYLLLKREPSGHPWLKSLNTYSGRLHVTVTILRHGISLLPNSNDERGCLYITSWEMHGSITFH